MEESQKRTRMISVRLTEEEYRLLRDICVETGASNISDTARQGIRTLFNGRVKRADVDAIPRRGVSPLESRVREIDARLHALDEALSRMARAFETAAGRSI